MTLTIGPTSTHCKECGQRLPTAPERMPFTVAALARIKNGATARDLGWPETFYISVCRKHGLEPTRSHPPKTQAAPEIAAVVAPPAPAAPMPDPEPLPDNGECVFETSSRTLRRGALTLTLAPRQAELIVLIAKATTEHPAVGPYLAERMHIEVHGGIGGHIVALRKKVAPLGIKIGAVAGRSSSGYFIADQTTGSPLAVKVVR